jgi:FkbH-like protein
MCEFAGKPAQAAAASPRRSALNRLAWQGALFADEPNRLALLRLGGQAPQGPTLHIFRNHAVEGMASVLAPFQEFAGYGVNLTLGKYDDSLSLPDAPYDAALVWLDFDRYPRLDDAELAAWIVGRLKALRAHAGGLLAVANDPGESPRAVVLNAALNDWAARTPAAAVLDVAALAAPLGGRAVDAVRAVIAGTRFTDALILRAARALMFDVLGRVYAAPIKALAVDLDNTLYRGVLGEDGVEGVELTEGHAALQRTIADLADRGVLISVVSRNDARDVERLFAVRSDFPLRPEHVGSWHVSWCEKSTAIVAAASGFNIAPDSFLFVDDNIGELAQAGSRLAGLRLLHAGDAAEATARALAHYPGVPRHSVSFAGRAADLAANAERAALAQGAIDEMAYLQALGAELTFAMDPAEDLQRLAEISRKTNQFNLALRRLDEVEVDRYLRESGFAVVHVRLADRLADSGSVAAAFLRRDGETLMVDELCISCRALGRRLEDLMVAEVVRAGLSRLGGAQAAFAWRRGPRNQPALDWLAAFTGQALEGDTGQLAVPKDKVAAAAPAAVTVRWVDG